MKKLLITVISILLLFAVTACNQQQEETTSKTMSAEKSTSNTVTIYLARHGETILNKMNRIQGWADAPLTEEGEIEAKYLGEGLKDIPFAAAYSGDSGRHIISAQIILKASGQSDVDLIQDERLRELYFGKFDGLLPETLQNAMTKSNATTSNDVTDLDIKNFANNIAKADDTGGAENWDKFSTRLHGVLDEISQTTAGNGGGNVLVVTSGLTINGLLSIVDPSRYKVEKIENSSITKLVYKGGKYIIESVNDKSFVKSGREGK